MKKINLFELLSIGVIILIGCFIISFTSKKMFRIDTDFLSAAATFFAGVVAYKLFYDWRLQYRTELLERLKDRFNSLLIKLEEDYDLLKDIVYTEKHNFNDSNVFHKIYKKVRIFRKTIENIQDELDFYHKLYVEFDLKKYEDVTSPTGVLDGLYEILKRTGLSENYIDDKESYLINLKKYIDSCDASNKIIDYKVDICRDLHIVIIDMIKDNKGH